MYSQTSLQRSATWNYKVDRWPLFGASETTWFSRDELRLAFVDRRPVLAGVLMHRFDCSNELRNMCYMCTLRTWVIYYLVIIRHANLTISQFDSRPCNEYKSGISMLPCYNNYTKHHFYICSYSFEIFKDINIDVHICLDIQKISDDSYIYYVATGIWFSCWRYLTREFIWHLRQSSITSSSIYVSSIWHHARICSWN